MNFQQVFGETFTEAWERFKDLLRKCPHHGFSLLHQIDFFYNGLCQSDQDSLNTAAGGNLMTRNTQDALTIIENKARVRTCRNKPQVSSSGGTSTQIDAITVLTKQVEALEYHFASMRETYDHNQEASNQLMQNQMELKVITSTDGLTLDGSFLSHSNFLEKDQEPETITEVVEIASSKSTPLVPPPETPPLSAPKPKEDLKPNPYQPPIPYPCRLQVKKFQALENPTGRVDHFVYRIDIVDSLCYNFSIENNSLSGSPTDPAVESLSPSLTPSGEIDLLLEETDAFLSLDDSIPLGIDNGIYDSEGDILFLEELLHDGIPKDLPPKELKDDEPSMTKSLIEKPLEIWILLTLVPIPRVFCAPLDSLESFFDPYDTSYTYPSELDSEYTLNYDNLIFNIQNEHCDEHETETIMDEIPLGESKVYIEVLSVLWGNRLPIPDGSLPLSSHLKGGGNNNNNKNCGLIKVYCLWSVRCRCGSLQKKAHSKNNKSKTDKSLLDHGRLAYRCDSFQKGRGSPGRNKTPGPWSARIPMWQLFKGPGGLIMLQ
ncbi:hypothetical protein Tco_0138831 [Tanacetum coccineum]